MPNYTARIRFKVLVATVLLVCGLAGCGGGGGSPAPNSPPPDSPPSVPEGFPLQAAFKARAATAQAEEFIVSGACNGTAAMRSGPPVASSFESVAGFQVSQSTQVDLTDCAPARVSSTGSAYLDNNYLPIGTSTDGQDFARYALAPQALPTSVKPGDSATVVTLNTFTNSSKLTPTGRRTLSFTVEADFATTVVVIVADKAYNTADQLLVAQQMRYRLDKTGALSLLRIDIQYSGTSQNRLTYTPKRFVISPPAGTPLSYPLQQAYKDRLATGSIQRFVVTGSCNGTATLSESAPLASNFEGGQARETRQTALLSFSDCSPPNTVVVGSNYYDANSLLLGSSTPGQEYAKVTGAIAALPSLVQVGDAAAVVPLNLFTDSSKTVAIGRRAVGFVIEPGGANSVVVNFTTQTYNTAEQLQSTQQERYALDATAVLKLLSIDFQAASGGLRLLYMPIPGNFTQVPAWPW